MKPRLTYSDRLHAALVSVLVSVPVGAALLGLAFLFGWEDLDGPADTGELAVGVALAGLTAVSGAAIQQVRSHTELGPEILLGPLVWYAELLVVGGVFSDSADIGKAVFGAVVVLGLVLQMTLVGARVAWALIGR